MLRTFVFGTKLISWAFVIFVCAANATGAPLRGELRRTVDNPFGTDPWIGWGLATDGEFLFASSARDGLIRVVDIPSLTILGTIATPASNLRGLSYRDGILYGVEERSVFPVERPSLFYALDANTGTVQWTFEGPSDGFSALSFGPDGLLYAADGYQGPGIAGTRVYGLDSRTGEILKTLKPRVVGDPPDDGDEIVGTSMMEWLPGGHLLIDFPIGNQNLNLPTIVDETLIPGPVFQVPGFSRRDSRQGATTVGNTLYLWGFSSGTTPQLHEIEIIPEPSGWHLLVAAIGAMMPLVVTRRAVSTVVATTRTSK